MELIVSVVPTLRMFVSRGTHPSEVNQKQPHGAAKQRHILLHDEAFGKSLEVKQSPCLPLRRLLLLLTGKPWSRWTLERFMWGTWRKAVRSTVSVAPAQGSVRCGWTRRHWGLSGAGVWEHVQWQTLVKHNLYHFIISKSRSSVLIHARMRKKIKRLKQLFALKTQSTILFVLFQTDSRWGLKHWDHQACVPHHPSIPPLCLNTSLQSNPVHQCYCYKKKKVCSLKI